MNEFLTINDLINRLSEIPVEDRDLPLRSDEEGSFISDIQITPNEDGTWYGIDIYYSMIYPKIDHDSDY